MNFSRMSIHANYYYQLIIKIMSPLNLFLTIQMIQVQEIKITKWLQNKISMDTCMKMMRMNMTMKMKMIKTIKSLISIMTNRTVKMKETLLIQVTPFLLTKKQRRMQEIQETKKKTSKMNMIMRVLSRVMYEVVGSRYMEIVGIIRIWKILISRLQLNERISSLFLRWYLRLINLRIKIIKLYLLQKSSQLLLSAKKLMAKTKERPQKTWEKCLVMIKISKCVMN